MKLLFDASALLNIVRSLGSDALEYLKGNYILTLTPYEVGNALWKEAALHGRITVNDALKLLGVFLRIYGFMHETAPSDAGLVLRVASGLRITYYDASYIVATREVGASLVTDDLKLIRRLNANRERLRAIIGVDLPVITSKDLAE